MGLSDLDLLRILRPDLHSMLHIHRQIEFRNDEQTNLHFLLQV